MSGRGRLALVFDDGYLADHEAILPVLAETDVPASFAIVSEWIGGNGRLSIQQIRELAEAGCEIVAHGRNHRVLQPHHLDGDAEAGDERLRIEGNVFPEDDAGVLVGDEYELTDGTRNVSVEVTGKGADGSSEYVELDGPLDEPWTAGDAVFRLPDALLEDEIVGAKADLEELGFDPHAFAFPYDAADVRSLRTAREEYDVLPNAVVRSLPNPLGTPARNLRRYYLETDALTRVEITEYLDTVAREGGLGILAGHSG